MPGWQITLIAAGAALLAATAAMLADRAQASAPVLAYSKVRVARRPSGSLAYAATVSTAAPASAGPLASLASPPVRRARSVRC